MNELTKEELEILMYCILRCKLYDKQSEDLFDKLDQSLIKLQSMINGSECQHESDGCYHRELGPFHATSSRLDDLPADWDIVNKCIKCGEFYK